MPDPVAIETDPTPPASTLSETAAPASSPSPSTPAPSSDSVSSPARTETLTQAQVDDAAWERLTSGESARTIQQSPGKVDPSSAAPGTNATIGGGRTDTPSAQEPAAASPNNGAAAQASQAKNYEGLDANGQAMLRRLKLLPADPERWNELPQETRDGVVANAQYMIRERGRRSQEIGQRRQQNTSSRPAPGRASPAASPAAADPAQAPDPSMDFDEAAEDAAQGDDSFLDPQFDEDAGGQPAPHQSRGQRDVRAEQQRGRAGRGPAPQQRIQKLRQAAVDYLSEEVSGELAGVLGDLAAENAHLREQAEAQEAERRLMRAQVYAPQEAEAWSKLTKQMGRPLNPHEQAALRQHADVFLQSSLNGPKPLTWTQALLLAGQSVHEPDIKLQAQQELAEGRRRSIRGSPVPPTSTAQARGNGRPTQADIDDAAWEGLTVGGEAPEAIRARFAR